MPTRTSLFLQGTACSIFATIGGFVVWTKHSKVTDLNPLTDPTFRSAFYRKFNLSSNPTTHDVCTRRIPLFKIKPELIEDAQNGGTKLVEDFCAGVWGGFGYTVQRLYLANKYQNSSTTAHQLWSKQQLLESPYDEGTEITDHFVVLAKTISPPPAGSNKSNNSVTPGSSSSSSSNPSTNSISNALSFLFPSKSTKTATNTSTSTSTPAETTPTPSPTPSVPASTPTTTQTILIRCGDSPLSSPNDPRASDGLFAIGTTVVPDKGYVEFTLKSVFYRGLPFEGDDNTGSDVEKSTRPPPMQKGSWILWAHQLYAKLWMESAVRNVMR